ncbi:MAG: chromosome segregation protein SMC [Oscillospiraceae bacterium]|nr:chromosome segregation protein SMC [Oscillospiraceae bacterium]
MRLKKLEIQGFKSFPDKTELAFDRPITAVVGPNGSGKSNIADAVRWVLGEQSTKTLRGGKMEDVIFSGAQGRKAVGYAHVQLVVDNADKQLTDQEDEITIARRLYRSGESEYRLNGVSVRLKDIHELLMDTGLGRDGYSIIGQGRIAEIVSAKSGSRREIFEEAAGISKFRYRKEEAERRLAQAEDNLVRLRDIVAELEDRVGPLKEQSEKAKEFLTLSEEKKVLEISLWMESLSGFRERLSAHGDKIYLAKNAYETLEKESEAGEVQIGALYSRLQGLGAEAEKKQADIKEIETAMTDAVSHSAVLQNDIHHNKLSIEELAAELESIRLGGGELAVQLADKEAELSAHKAECTAISGKVEATAQRLEEQRETLAKAVRELEEIALRKESAAQAIQQARLEKASGRTMLEESATRLEDLRGQSGTRTAALTELQQALAESKTQLAEEEEKAAGLRNSLEGYALKRDLRQQSMDKLADQMRGYADEARDLDRRAGLLEDLEKNMEGFAGSVKYILDQSRRGALSGVIGAVSSLISTEDKYALAIETALGAAIQNIIVEDDGAAKRAIAMLKESRSGRATFLPLNTIKERPAGNMDAARKQEGFIGLASELVKIDSRYQKVAGQLLGRVCVAEDLESAGQIAKVSGYSLRVVSLDGQVINPGGSFTGGSSSKSAGVLGRRREIERLRQKAEEVQAKAGALAPKQKALSEELSALAATISGVKGELRTSQEEAVRLTATGEQLQKNVEGAKRDQTLAEQELQKLTQRLGELKNQDVDADTAIGEMQSRLDELEEQTQSALRRKDSLNVGAEAALAALSEHKMLELTAQKDLESLTGELERLRSAKESSGERAQELETKRQGLAAENEKTQERIAEAGQENDRRQKEKEEIQAKVAELVAMRNELEGQITTLHAAERERGAHREKVARELAELESQKSVIQNEYDQIIAKLWEEYELTRSEAAQFAQELPNKDKAGRRLGELRGKIRGLGVVNVAAIEEYKQVSERYEFLTAQVADVEKSKATLSRLIGDLTGEMRALFEENFGKIAAEFSKIFVQLFGGGRGELTLTDTQDVLEAGVEIFVQPPGKIIKNLSLLSGGEQAFVAIAIYFAILRVRPSPFCVLDEIEAALDDVNVTKFAAYLRRMCEGTQFISITHRRGTMEEADVLYGVTMQEEGISKLLELKVSEVEARLGI